MEILKLSPTSLNLYVECPRCFWLKFNRGISRPSVPFPSLPGGMDLAIKAYFDRFRPELPPELSSLSGFSLYDGPELAEWRNTRKGVRWSFSTDEHEVLVFGGVDDILVHGDKLVVLDYKTRGYPPKPSTSSYYSLQLSVYAMLLEKNGYDVEPYAYLSFFYPRGFGDNGFSFNVELSKVDVDTSEAERVIRDAVSVLESEIPESAETCEFCRWAREWE